ncbi:MAG: hypothetical protein WBX00_29815 [Isosphaeraceae bacterium]
MSLLLLHLAVIDHLENDPPLIIISLVHTALPGHFQPAITR